MIILLIRNAPTPVPPPVHDMESRWNPAERNAVQAFLGAAINWDPDSVRSQLLEFQSATGVDELMIHSGFHDHADRLKSYEILANAFNLPANLPARNAETEDLVTAGI